MPLLGALILKGYNMSILATIGGATAISGAQSLMGMGNSFVGGAISNYWGSKQASANYQYAKKYAKNSPTWTVEGLRKAGLNPILAAGGGFNSGGAYSPMSASVSNVSPTNIDPVTIRQLKLLDKQIEGQDIKNRNDRLNMGLSGRDATVARLANELGLTPERIRDFFGFDIGHETDKLKSNQSEDLAKLLLLNDRSAKSLKSYLINRPAPLVTVEKAVDYADRRFRVPSSSHSSYMQWLDHPSNKDRRSRPWSENEYLFMRDVKSGSWRKKADGKFGYK